MCVCVCSVAQSCLTVWRPHGLLPSRLFCPCDSPGKNTGELPFPYLGDVPDPVMKLAFLASPALAGRF